MRAAPGVTTIKAATAMIIAIIFTGALSPLASGFEFSQDGRRTSSNAVDGSYSRLAGHGFSPNPGQCVLYSTLVANGDGGTGNRQLQAGLLRCNSNMLTGSCPDGQVFVERYTGNAYYCIPGYSFTNGTQYDATVLRAGAGSAVMNANINGASVGQGGFRTDEINWGTSWGEAVGGLSCPAPSRGTFVTWKRYDSSNGWLPVTGSSTFHSGTLPHCWPSITATDTDGGFEVD